MAMTNKFACSLCGSRNWPREGNCELCSPKQLTEDEAYDKGMDSETYDNPFNPWNEEELWEAWNKGFEEKESSAL